MLQLGSTSFDVEGVTVFTDDADPDQFWYLPAPVRLADREGGDKAFTLITYKPAAISGGAHGGGFFMFQVNLRLSDDQTQSIIGALRRLSKHPKLSPVPFDEGEVQCVALNVQGAAGTAATPAPPGAFVAVEEILGAAVPSLFGDNDAIFSLTLSQEGATILKQAFAQGATPVGVIYKLKFTGLRPSLHVRITADLSRVYESFTAGLSAQVYWVRAGIEAAFQKLVQDGVIHIEVKNFSTDANKADQERWALDFFKDKLLAEWFTPSLSPTSVPTGIAPTLPGQPGTPGLPGTAGGTGGLGAGGAMGGQGGVKPPGSGGMGAGGGMTVPGGGVKPPGLGGPVAGGGMGIPGGGVKPPGLGGPTGGPVAGGLPGGGMGAGGLPGGGMGGAGLPGAGLPGTGLPGGGMGAGGLPGAGLPGAGLPGAGLPGAGLPGAGLPGAGLPGTGLPGTGLPGGGMGAGGLPGAGVGGLPGLPGLPGHPILPTGGAGSSPAGTGMPTSTGGGAKPAQSGPPLQSSGGVDTAIVSFKLSYVHQEEEKHLTLELDRADAVQRTYAPQGFFSALASELSGPTHFVDVDLDDPFFREFAVDLRCRVDFASIGLSSIAVALDYGDDGDPHGKKHQDYVFDAANSGEQRFDVFMSPSLATTYHYRVEYHFDSASGWLGDETTYVFEGDSEDRTMELDPYDHLGFLNVSVAPRDIDPGVLAATDVHLSYTDPGGTTLSGIVAVKPDSPPQAWRVRTPDRHAREYAYQLVHTLTDGKVTTMDPVTTEATTVAVADPFPGRLDIDLVPSWDATAISKVFVDIVYDDPADAYHREERRELAGAVKDTTRLSIALRNADLRTFSHRATFMKVDNTVVQSAFVSTDDTLVSLQPG